MRVRAEAAPVPLYPYPSYNPTCNPHAREGRGGPIVDVRVRDAEGGIPVFPLLDGGHAGLASQPAADAHFDALQWSHKCVCGGGQVLGHALALRPSRPLMRTLMPCNGHTSVREDMHKVPLPSSPVSPLPFPHLDEGISLDAADEEALNALPRHVGLQRRCDVRGDHRRALEDVVEEKGPAGEGGGQGDEKGHVMS